MAGLDASQKFALITKNLAEVLDPELIMNVLKERDLKVYWGSRQLLFIGGLELKMSQELLQRVECTAGG